jgi:hypothetical protein
VIAIDLPDPAAGGRRLADTEKADAAFGHPAP